MAEMSASTGALTSVCQRYSPAQARKQAWCGAKDVPFASGGHHRRVDGKRHLGDDLTHQTLVPTPDEDVRETREGRIAKLLAQRKLAFEEALPIMRGCGAYGRMLGPVGLDDNVPGLVGTTCPAAHLLEQLEGFARMRENREA